MVTQNPRRCCLLITKLLFLLVKGETFTSSEITEVFFGVTKLFQSPDVNLRRMMYLFIKEIAETCNPDDVIIVTSSLTKDMNTGEDLYRANSMRVLAKIIDAAMLSAIERYLKQAIVDRNAFVASSALMAGLQLFRTCPDIVRRWINEVQEAVSSVNDMVQFHALSLLYKIKQHDRLSVSKTVQQLSKGTLRSPLATCLLIRYTSSLLREDMTSTNARASYQFLENCLRHKNEMVIYEAAKAICRLPGVEANDLSPAITVLQLFLTSPKSSLRFAAIRTLSEVATKHPISLLKCNDDMEGLVADSNRSIATLAITTLLKTGTEASIDRLMKKISAFMTEIGDEFKIVVVQAVRELCLKYPGKNRVLVGFLSTFLREEGGYEFKKSIVDSILDLIQAIPETKETSLLHLCEFIDDCEFSELIVQVMHVLGRAGPTTSSPSKYIRFVFNRLILENAVVRAAAVTTLGAFAVRLPELRPSILILLKRSLTDDDDEVRDRAATLVKTLEGSQDEHGLHFLLEEPLPMSFAALDRSMRAYLAHPSSATETRPVTLASLPIVEDPYSQAAAAAKVASTSRTPGASTAAAKKDPAEVVVTDPASALYKIPELAHLGRAFRSCPEVALTESEMEYVVSCVKHIFNDHIVLQFSVVNTIDDQRLKDVGVAVEISDEDLYAFESEIQAPVAKYGETAYCYVVLARVMNEEAEETLPGANVSISCNLKFHVIQVEPTTGEIEGDEDGYEEEYALESLDINTNDFMAKITYPDFRKLWEQTGTEGEVLEKFALQFKKLSDAVTAVIDFLGMQPCDNTGTVTELSMKNKSHTLHLSGMFLGNITVLVRAQLQLDDSVGGVVLKIAVRSEKREISTMVAECIR